MASLNFNLNNSLRFPPLAKLNSKAKQQHQRKTRNHDTKNLNKDDENNNDQTYCIEDRLNDTLLELIFLTLHWRNLAICKCVSKRWNSIISNPDFLRLLPFEQYSAFTLYLRGKKLESFHDKTCGTTCLVTDHPYFQTHKLRLDFRPTQYRYFDPDDYLDIVATHKDLLVSYCTRNSVESAYYVANPLTKQFIEVPLSQTQASDEFQWDDIDYDYYSNWPPCWVVGFAGVVEGVSNSNGYNNNNGFRIIRFVGDYADVIQIYSSKTGRWMSYLWDNTDFYLGSTNKAVTLNDKVYYQGRSQILIVDPFPDDFIEPRVLNLPDEISSKISILGFSRNRLHIAQFEQQCNVSKDYPRIKVWEFEEDCNELTITNGITKMAELRLIIDFPLKPTLFEGIMSPIFSTIPTIQRHRSDGVFCCHPYDPHIVYFSYRNTFYQCDVVKRRLKVVTYHDWTERHVFLHSLMMTPK